MVVFALGEGERPLSDEHAQWLIEELMASDAEEAPALAARIQRARFTHERVELSRAEARPIIQVFERSTRPRSVELRAFEVGLYALGFAEPGE